MTLFQVLEITAEMCGDGGICAWIDWSAIDVDVRKKMCETLESELPEETLKLLAEGGIPERGTGLGPAMPSVECARQAYNAPVVRAKVDSGLRRRPVLASALDSDSNSS